MAKVNLGDKQACPECEKKFYDLTKRPAVCPYCSVSFDPTELTAKSSAVVSNVDETAKDAPETETEDDEVDEDEATAKELELDGDSANFGSDGSDGDDDGDASRSTPDMDGFQSSDDEDEDGTSTDSDEEDALPPTQKDGEEPEEVEI